MRLFAGISLPESTLYQVEAFVCPLRSLAPVRWTPSANLHITTKFIGEWPIERVAALAGALKGLSSRDFEITVKDLGWFPNARSPHVLWLGVFGGELLSCLAAQTEDILSELNCPREQRDFNPHLTIARMRRESDLRNLRQAIDSQASPCFAPFSVSEFHLYQSDAGIYRKLHTFSLATSTNAKTELLVSKI